MFDNDQLVVHLFDFSWKSTNTTIIDFANFQIDRSTSSQRWFQCYQKILKTSVKNVTYQKNITLLMFKSSSSVLAVRKINLPAPRVASGANWIWETAASPLFTISTKEEVIIRYFMVWKWLSLYQYLPEMAVRKSWVCASRTRETLLLTRLAQPRDSKHRNSLIWNNIVLEKNGFSQRRYFLFKNEFLFNKPDLTTLKNSLFLTRPIK